ncbi:MAG: haloacid dehalogenase-like hydrolase [Muribaculum sp.]|nr:haloacid dehalogenase-like hydrolase [Muribaculum sp.]
MTGATFVDLDGTLLQGNSMKMFMRRLPGVLLRHHALGASLSSLWWMGLRSLRLVSHKNMKWHLTGIGRRHLLEEEWEEMAERMLDKVNPAVKEYMEAPAREKCRKYIATAAMEEYARPLSRLLGCDGVVATQFAEDKSDYMEMRGPEKRDGIEALMEKERLRLESFLTDHYDDLPTASVYPFLTILVNPSRKMQALFRNVGVTRYLR